MIRIDCREISGDDIGKSEHIRRAYDGLVRHGYAILDNVLAEEKVHALAAEFEQRYAEYLVDRDRDDTLEVGQRRYMIPVAFTGGFADPLVYANPYVVALARLALDDDAILDSFGAFVALAGSERQHFHRDARLLFDSGISAILPAHALTVVMPLVEMNDLHGTTAIWPGSHRWKTRKERDESVAPLLPKIPVGSCLIWDYRLYHRGMPNVSNRHRPIVHSGYSRAWYHDPVNFKKKGQRRLVFDDGFLQDVPEDRRRLFVHAG